MMIGLPGDTIEKAIYTANKIIESGAHETRLYPTLVIRDTALHKLYSNEKYKPLTLKQAVEWTKQILPLFEEAGVRLIRVGLHPSDGLVSGNELVDGPFHSSFKELVISSLWADLLTPLLINGTDKNIEIHVPTKEINYAIGHKSADKKMLLERFNSVKFVPEVSYSARNFTLKSLN
jgi:histone acetyltransferase (RNA polymerase elongator complex component)